MRKSDVGFNSRHPNCWPGSSHPKAGFSSTAMHKKCLTSPLSCGPGRDEEFERDNNSREFSVDDQRKSAILLKQAPLPTNSNTAKRRAGDDPSYDPHRYGNSLELKRPESFSRPISKVLLYPCKVPDQRLLYTDFCLGIVASNIFNALVIQSYFVISVSINYRHMCQSSDYLAAQKAATLCLDVRQRDSLRTLPEQQGSKQHLFLSSIWSLYLQNKISSSALPSPQLVLHAQPMLPNQAADVAV
jgi:hypothetical protein